MRLGGTEGLFLLALAAVFVAVWWQIFKKTGNSPWLSLLMVLPLVNLLLILYLAFSDWPVLRELRMLRSELPATPESS